MNITALLSWAHSHWMDRQLPWRNPKEPMVRRIVVEALLAQTRAESVADRYAQIFTGIQTFLDFDRYINRVVEEAGLLGLPWLKKMALWSLLRWSKNQHYPHGVEYLCGQPGIGEYTWGMIALLFGFEATPVDCNVRRVGSRVDPSITPAVWIGEVVQAARALPPVMAGFANGYVAISGVLDLGATYCHLGCAPRCKECPLCDACAFAQTGHRQMEL